MRFWFLLTAAVLAMSAVVFPSSAAHAVSADVVCVGAETVTYEPGLLLTPQTVNVTVHGVLAPCTSSDPDITSGTYTQHFTTTLSCATVLGGLAATRIFKWSDGQSSSFSYNRAINNVAGQTTVTFTGTIGSGKFMGDTAIEQVVFVTLNALQCLTPPGLTTLGPGPATLTIARI
jgi:hypothetical protein